MLVLYKQTYVNIGLSSTYIQTECNIFGSSRVGVYYPPDRSMISDSPGRIATRYRNYRRYEVSNHLGNVMSVVTDRLKGNPAALPQRVSAYEPDIVAAQDYYPFGQVMRGRNFPTMLGKSNFPTKYRYGFNDKEADADGEIQNLTTYDYGFRIYNPGIARFLSVDPLTSSYPYYTPYQFAGNGPIANIDLDGLEPQSKGKENEVRCAPDQKSGVEGDWTYRGDDIGWTPNSIEEVVITPEKTNNRLEVFNNWRNNPYFNNGETPLDRWIRLGGAFAHETSRDYAAGGFNMYNGFARIKPAVNIIKYVDEVEVVATKTSSQILSWGNNAKGHLIKHADVLGFGGHTPQQLQKMLPQLRGAANQLLNGADAALTRVGQWHGHQNAIMYISNGKMLVTEANGTFITVINKTSNN